MLAGTINQIFAILPILVESAAADDIDDLPPRTKKVIQNNLATN